MILFAEGLFYAYPMDEIGKIEITQLNYEESLYWNKRIEGEIADIEVVKPGDIILNRRFIGDVAHWYLFRFKYF